MALVGQTVPHARQYMHAFSAKGSDLSYSFRLLPGPFEVGPSCGLRFQPKTRTRSEEHTSELQSQSNLVCRLLLEKKKLSFRRLLHGRIRTRRRMHSPCCFPLILCCVILALRLFWDPPIFPRARSLPILCVTCFL